MTDAPETDASFLALVSGASFWSVCLWHKSPQPHTERSSRSGPEPSYVEADVYLVVHARKEEVGKCRDNLEVSGSAFGDVTG